MRIPCPLTDTQYLDDDLLRWLCGLWRNLLPQEEIRCWCHLPQLVCLDWEVQWEQTVDTLFGPWGGIYEFCFMELPFRNGIEHQKTVPHTPQQNGRAEHFNRTLLDTSEAMRQHACLPPTFWQDAIETSLHIYNRQPMRRLNWYSPIQLWNGTKPDVSYFRTFGCQAYVCFHTQRQTSQQTHTKVWRYDVHRVWTRN